MQHSIKTSLSLLIAFVLLISLAACGGKTGKEATTTIASSAAAVGEVATDKPKDDIPKEIKTFKMLMFNDWYKAGWQALEKDINDNAATLGFKLEIEKIVGGSPGEALIKARFASGELPDFLYYYTLNQTTDALGGIKNFSPIDGDWTKNFPESLMQNKSFAEGGKVYGIPMDSTVLLTTLYNKKVFEKLSLKVPTNWTEFLAVCEAIKASGTTPIYFAGKDAWTLQAIPNDGFLREYGKTPLKDVFSQIDTNKMHYVDLKLVEDSLAKLKDLVDKGYGNKTYLSDSYDDAQKALAEGTAAMHMNGTWIMDEINKKFPDKVNDIGSFPVPFDGNDKSSALLPFVMMMTSNVKDKEAGQRVVDYLASKEAQQLFFDAQPGLSVMKGITAKLFPAQADAAQIIADGRTDLFWMQVHQYDHGTFDKSIQDLLVGQKTPAEVLKALDDATAKAAKAKNDPNWK